MIVGLIPARGGSKGIPRKNLQRVNRKTLLERGISLLFSGGCEEVYVSTEDSEISNYALEFGAKVILRPNELATDTAGTDSVLLHSATVLNLNLSDILVLHQLTSPLLESKSVKGCIEALRNAQLASSMSVRFAHPFMWSQVDTDDWQPVGHTRDFRPRRQELGVQGIETGGCYAMRVGALLEQKCRFPQPTLGIEVSFIESLDIDTGEDLEIASMILEKIEENK